jgi:hypothetical protein
MLSNVESIDIAAQLRAAERGAAAPYISYPPSPWWYAPAVGAWAAAFVGSFIWWRVNGAMFATSLAILIALEAGFVQWMRRRHGALPMPGRGSPPSEIAVVWRGYGVGVLIIAIIVALAWWLGGIAVAAPAAFVSVTLGLIWYERSYARAAQQVRERLP